MSHPRPPVAIGEDEDIPLGHQQPPQPPRPVPPMPVAGDVDDGAAHGVYGAPAPASRALLGPHVTFESRRPVAQPEPAEIDVAHLLTTLAGMDGDDDDDDPSPIRGKFSSNFVSHAPASGNDADYRPTAPASSVFSTATPPVSNAFSTASAASIVPTRRFGDCNLARIHNTQTNLAFAGGPSAPSAAALPSSTTSATPAAGKLRSDTRFDFPVGSNNNASNSNSASKHQHHHHQPQPHHVDAAVLLSKPASTVTSEPPSGHIEHGGDSKKSIGGGTYKTAPNGPMAYNHVDIISESAREGGPDETFAPGTQLFSLCIQGMPANADDNYLVSMVEKHCPAFVKAELVSVHVPAMTRASLKKNHNKRFGFLNYKTREAAEATTVALDRLDIPPVGYLRVQPSVPKRGFRAATAAAAAAVEKTANNFGTGI